MAGVEADTSSYPRPSLPVSPLDIASKLGGLQQQSQAIQQGAVNLDASKLELYNKHYQIMQNELSTLANDPATTKEEALTRMHRVSDGFNSPKGVRDQMEAEFANVPGGVPLGKNPVLARTLELIIRRGMDMSQRINQQIGPKVFQDTGQGLKGLQVPGSPSLPISETGDFIQKRIAPAQGVVSPEGQSRLFGEQGDVPMQRSGPRLPIAPALPSGPMDPSAIPGLPSGTRAIAAQVMPATTPTGPATGMLPGFEEGLKQRTADQDLATQKMTAVKPLLLAYPKILDLRSGPGTATWNNAVAFLKANNIVSTDANDPTAIYQEANKYFNQYVSRNGSRSDAEQSAKEMANPDIKTHINPALVELTKKTIAQDRIEAARPGAFRDKDFSRYGEHRSQFPQSMNIEAAHMDLLPPAERKQKFDSMLAKAKKGDANAVRFIKTLSEMRQQNMHDFSIVP